MATTRTVLRSAHCYHLQDPSEAHKQLKTRTMIPLTNDSMTTKKLSCDGKEMMVEELAEVVIDFLEFHGMDSEFYLPDPQDASKLCFILWEDAEDSPSWVVKYFRSHIMSYDNYATNNMDYQSLQLSSFR